MDLVILSRAVRGFLLLALVGQTAPNALGAESCDRAAFRVALDVGHDRTHPGATSARGVSEFDYNLSLSELVLRRLKEEGFTTAFRIGETGSPIALGSRPAQARQANASVFISLHHDSAQKEFFSTWSYEGRALPFSDRFHGYSIFVSSSLPTSPQSLVLATDLGRALRAAGLTPSLHHAMPVPGEGRAVLNADLGIYEFGQLAVLRGATMPALLLESGVIVNRDEEQAIRSGAYHAKIASALVGAITAFCTATQRPAGVRRG